MRMVPLHEQLAQEEKTNDVVESTGAAPAPHECPRCGLPLDQPYVFTPTTDDTREFAATLIPGAGVRFLKSYTLPGGTVLKFRQLIPEEARAIQWQLNLDRQNDENMTISEWHDNGNLYLLAWHLYEIAPAKGTAIGWSPSLVAIGESTRENTTLPANVNWMFANMLTNESLQRLALQFLIEFRMLLANLEALARNPDFYRGIATSA